MAADTFTTSPAAHTAPQASSPLAHWNTLAANEAARSVLPCCGSQSWAQALAAGRPFLDEANLLERSDLVWAALPREDWQQAFDSHPRLGETQATAATNTSLAWSRQEQTAIGPSGALREANARYEARFGHIFLLCAAGLAAPQILEALEARLGNTPEAEWREAGEQQRLITRLRLQRWLRGA